MLSHIAGFFQSRFLPISSLLGLLWMISAAFQFFLEKYSDWAWSILLCAVLLLVILRLLRDPLASIPLPVFLVALLIIFLISRRAWIMAIPTMPFSDFAGYDTLAKAYVSGQPSVNQLPWPLFAYSQGYPLVLAGWYGLFGTSLSVAKILNIILGIGALFALYIIGHRFSEQTARIACLLFCLWPTQLTFSSVLASEHLALFLFLTSLVFLIASVEGNVGRSILLIIVAGGVLALAYASRGTLVLGFLAAIVLILSLPKSRLSKMINLANLCLGFLFVMGLFLLSVKQAYGFVPVSQGYSTLLTGTNFASKGGWNQRDAQAFFSHATMQEANQAAFKTALQRITSNPLRFARLILIKIPRLWEDETYGVYWSTLNFDDFPYHEKVFFTRKVWAALSQGFHLLMLTLSAIIAWQAARYGRSHPALTLVWLLFLGGLLFHAVFEVQARYHYWMEPLLILLSAVWISSSVSVQINGSPPTSANG